MTSPLLYDREKERYDLRQFLLSKGKHYLIVHGESGSGKTHIVDDCLNDYNFNEIETYQFSEDDWGNTEDLTAFIVSMYCKYRGQFIDRVKSVRVKSFGVGLSGPSASFSLGDKPIVDNQYVSQLTKKMREHGVKVLWLSNVELVRSSEVEIIKAIVNSKQKHIKIVIEIGTLADEHNKIISFIKQNCSAEELFVENFNKFHATKFYAHLREEEPPPDLYGRTLGNPLCITHFSRKLERPSIEQYVDERINSLCPEQLEIVYSVHIFNGEVDVEYLSKLFPGNNFHGHLELLEKMGILEFREGAISYSHAHFAKSVSHRAQSHFMNTLRLRILNSLDASTASNQLDYLEFVTRQYLFLKRDDMAIKFGWEAILLAYKSQMYHYVNGCSQWLMTVAHDNSDAMGYLAVIHLQSQVLLGSAANANKCDRTFAHRGKFNLYMQLLEAMRLYQANQFQESVAVIDELMRDENIDDSIVALAHGINSSTYIGMGMKEKAHSHFSSAVLLAEQSTIEEYSLELSRLKPKIYGFELGAEMLKNDIDANKHHSTEYTLAKCYHNYGFSVFLTTMEDNGALEIARKMFERLQVPELTYSMVARSVMLIAQKRTDDAFDVLYDALNLCHEQYDRFSVHTNLGNCHLIKNNLDEAEDQYLLAKRALLEGERPLNDPILTNKSHHNLALINSFLGRWDLADSYSKQVGVPEFSHFPIHRQKRLQKLQQHVSERSTIPIEFDSYNIKKWPVTRFAFAIAKLSFYDFNIRSIPADLLPNSLQPLSFDLPTVRANN